MTNNQEQAPWLSIVVPIYNTEKFLDKCLKSIQKQTFKSYEVIMVDDGSTDGSGIICQRYSQSDQRFRYLRKENGGCFAARVFGAKRAKGEYVTFCDADDFYFTPKAFHTINIYLKQGQYDVLQFQLSRKYNHLYSLPNRNAVFAEANTPQEVSDEYAGLLCNRFEKSHLTPSLCTKVYHKKFITNFPALPERLFWGEDLVSNLHLLATCKSICIVPIALYAYRQGSGGTDKFSRTTMQDLNVIKEYQQKFLPLYSGDEKSKIIDAMHSEVAAWFFCFIQQGLDQLPEKELEVLIEETLMLPAFVRARQYYLTESPQHWEAVDLLREADPKQYIAHAKEKRAQKPAMKYRIVELLKKIYSAI